MVLAYYTPSCYRGNFYHFLIQPGRTKLQTRQKFCMYKTTTGNNSINIDGTVMVLALCIPAYLFSSNLKPRSQ